MNTYTIGVTVGAVAVLVGLGYLAMAVWISGRLEDDIHKDDRE